MRYWDRVNGRVDDVVVCFTVQESEGASSLLEFFARKLQLPLESAVHPEVFIHSVKDMIPARQRLLLIVDDCDNTSNVEPSELQAFLKSLSAFVGDSMVLLLTYVHPCEGMPCKVRGE